MAFRTGNERKRRLAQQRQPSYDRVPLQFLERTLSIEPLVESERHILVDGQCAEHSSVLEGTCQATFGNIRHTQSGNGFAVDIDQTGVGLDESGNQIDGGRFAGTIRADDGHHFALMQVEGDIVDGFQAVERFLQITHLKHGRRVQYRTTMLGGECHDIGLAVQILLIDRHVFYVFGNGCVSKGTAHCSHLPCEQTLRPEQNNEDQQHAVQQHARIGGEAQQFRSADQNNRA